MADPIPADRRPRVRSRVALALAATCAVAAWTTLEGASRAAAAAVSTTTTAAATTTTLPALPTVSATYTDGQTAASLLAKAITLASVGIDDTALTAAIDGTQARMDADALDAHQADEQEASADKARSAAERAAGDAQAEYQAMASAVDQAVLSLYMAGPDPLPVSPTAGALALYAQDYADSTLGPYGVLAQRAQIQQTRRAELQAADRQARLAGAAAVRAARALADQKTELARLQEELTSVSSASAAAVADDHATLASQAGKELLSDDSLQFDPKSPIPAPVSTTLVALTWAFAELGKQYVWGATGPDTFDCSGLTQFVWKAAGVTIPRVAADQDSWTIPVPLSQLLPGDLVFFGRTDVHHVGIYIGDGLMINAPHTGTVVQVSSIWWSDLAGFGRVHTPGTPVPPHDTPSPKVPAALAVVPTAGPVPSQTKPPAGWKPAPGETTPISISGGKTAGGAPTTTTTTIADTSSTLAGAPATSTTTTTPSIPTTTSTDDPSATDSALTVSPPASPSTAQPDPVGS